MRLTTHLLLLCLLPVSGHAQNRLAELANTLAPGQWLKLPTTNRISDVYPDQRGHPAWGVLGPKAVVVAWGGGAVSEDALYVTGGGHGDYGGNEVYRFRFEDLTWERLTDPSPYNPGCKGICQTVDGTPTSAHTYDGIQWLPKQRRLWVGSGSAYRSGSAVRQAFAFDPEKRAWQKLPSPLVGWLHSDYDPESGLLLVGSHQGVLAAYDPNTRTYPFRSPRGWKLGGHTGALDIDTRQFVIPAGNDKTAWQALVYDLKAVPWKAGKGRLPSGKLVTTFMQKPNGEWKPGAPRARTRSGISYDNQRKRLTLWDGGAGVWTLDTTTWRWTKHKATGSTPRLRNRQGREHTRGVFGRWRYLPAWDVFLGYDDPQGSPWLYRPE